MWPNPSPSSNYIHGEKASSQAVGETTRQHMHIQTVTSTAGKFGITNQVLSHDNGKTQLHNALQRCNHVHSIAIANLSIVVPWCCIQFELAEVTRLFHPWPGNEVTATEKLYLGTCVGITIWRHQGMGRKFNLNPQVKTRNSTVSFFNCCFVQFSIREWPRRAQNQNSISNYIMYIYIW